MKLLVTGAGATGGYFGGRLAQAGRDVTFLVNPQRAIQLRHTGLLLMSPHGNVQLTPQLLLADQIGREHSRPFDVVLLAVRSQALEATLADLAPAMGPDTLILPLVSGMRPLEQVEARFGAHAVLGGLCRLITRLGPRGEIIQTGGPQEIVHGEKDGSLSARLIRLHRFLTGAGFDATLSLQILQDMWQEWVMLASAGGLNGLLHGDLGRIATPSGRELATSFLKEVAAVAGALGHPPSPVAQRLTERVLLERAPVLTAFLHRDLQAGHPCEAQQIISELAERAQQAGVPAPLLDKARASLTIHLPTPPAPPTFSAAIHPVEVADMPAVLARDFETALRRGALSHRSLGVTIGVLRRGVRDVFTYGRARQDSVYEIGSITKTFTGLMLARMITEGRVQIDTPLRELLPPGTVARPAGAEITLGDLVAHRSGLPRMPAPFTPADPLNPYAGYSAVDLHRYIARHGVARPAQARFAYSNLGFALLGQALTHLAGEPYTQLLAGHIATPLALKDTRVRLDADQELRLAAGHTPEHLEMIPWDFEAFAGSGAIRSTADDLLTYLQAHLEPHTLAGPDTATLARALPLALEPRAQAYPGMHVGFAWLHEEASGLCSHEGSTGGHSAHLFLHPWEGYAGVVLVNTAAGQRNLASLIGRHIAARFAGTPAVDL